MATEMPMLLKAASHVVRCAGCHRQIARVPAFFGDPYEMDQCSKCGCTSFTVKEGRPYGPKSKDWGWVLEQWSSLWIFIDPRQVNDVTTDPPMSEVEIPFRW